MSEDGAGDDSQTEERKERTEPGGGPKRVVSNRSVDDILESLDSTAGERTNEMTDTVSEDTDSAVGGERAATFQTEDDDYESARSGASSEDPTERNTDRDDEIADDGHALSDDGHALSDDGHALSDDGHTLSDDGHTLSDDGHTHSDDENLEARIDAGTVTGADVRVAETGDGREATPEIDEIDLSLDDIDESPATHHEPSDETDGPFDGRVGTSAGSSIAPSSSEGLGDESTAEIHAEPENRDSPGGETPGSQDKETSESQDGEATGLLGRLRRLF